MIRRAASLRYFWRAHVAIAAGAAVATAVLSGALLVGDSVRTSLQRLTLERLGQIELALPSESFVPGSLAARLGSHPALDGHRTVAALLVRGAARSADTLTRASRVAAVGIDDDFLALFADVTDPAALAEARAALTAEGPFPAVILNAELARELRAERGDDVLLTLPRWSRVPRASLLGRKASDEILETVRVTVAAILPDRGIGRFALSPHQSASRTAFLLRSVLEGALDAPGRTNLILVAGDGSIAAAAADRALAEIATLNDLGLDIRVEQGRVTISSRELVLRQAIEDAVLATARELELPHQTVLTYLANSITHGDRSTPYSTVAAVDPTTDVAGGSFPGHDATIPGDGVVLNEWLADDLAAGRGDTVELTYWVVGDGERLVTRRRELVVAGVVPIAALAGDSTLTPALPGIHDAADMASWDPPFPVDMSQIRAVDERYWDDFRATPKAFVALATGKALWTSRYGGATAIRIGVPPGSEASQVAASLTDGLRRRLGPHHVGLAFQGLRASGLAAADGSTDFSGLFVGFSFFLILAAVLLVDLLFALGIESRAREVGLLLALGFPRRTVRRRFLAEGALLATIGGLVGSLLAILYAGFLMYGLRTWWRAAVGSSDLRLTVGPTELIIGFSISVLVTAASIAWTLRQLGRIPATALLGGRATLTPKAIARSRAGRTAFVALAAAIALIVFASATGRSSSAPLFFVIGSAVLVAGLAGLRHRLTAAATIHGAGGVARARMAFDAAARRPGRSLMSASLVACAAFVLVAVAANRREFGAELDRRDSGAGGFDLVAEADVPLYASLDDPDTRADLGLSNADEDLLQAATLIGYRLRPGDDASCLNLYRPARPRILGVPATAIERGGFRFAASIEPTTEPWRLLDQELGPGVVPTIADAETAQWILKLGLGDELEVTSDDGSTLRLRLVATLQSSIFQSELLISETAFRQAFTDHAGDAFFLIDTDRPDAVTTLLESALGEHGLDVTTTAARLGAFQAVANTYLSTFLLLGGLGLLLGTLGLAVVLVRNVVERRGELATLTAFGYRRRTLTGLIAGESAMLLIAGLLIGTAAALIANAPHLVAHGGDVSWRSLAVTLGTCLVIGIGASAVAAVLALRSPVLALLKGD